MAITHFIPVGTTEAQVFQALPDDTVTDFTGATIALSVRDKNDRPVTITGTVAFADATIGTWSYTPNGELTPGRSPYRVRLQLTLSGVAMFPNDQEPDTWHIVR